MNICPQHDDDCPGYLYLALNTYGLPFIKHGFTHTSRSLTRRESELQRAGLHIVWTSGRFDAFGEQWRYSREQNVHALIRECQLPYTGLEYYEISRPLIAIVDDQLLTRHANRGTRIRTLRILGQHLDVNGWWNTTYDTGTP